MDKKNQKPDSVDAVLGGEAAFLTSPHDTDAVLGSKERLKIELQTFTFPVITVNEKGEIINRKQCQAQYFTEYLGEGIGLDMVSIPRGNFMMGSAEGEGLDWEKPQHQVTVPPFFIGKYPITQAQWQTVAALPKVKIDLKSHPSWFVGAKLPVESVSWYEVEEFCARLSQLTGKNYRIPSEAEWEYACRGGTTTPYNFGEAITIYLANYHSTAWEGGNTPYRETYGKQLKEEYREHTTDVGAFGANAFGLYDMHGNVWEWCSDTWHNRYNSAPSDGSTWVDDLEDQQLLRGGSWNNYAWFCRAAYRNHDKQVNRSNDIGFRVVCS